MRIRPEPVHPRSHRVGTRSVSSVSHHSASALGARPTNVEALILQIQREFPNAHIRITGRGRTVRRQAELMAQRRRANRKQFLETYHPAAHITEMDHWVAGHTNASEAETVSAFEGIIERARRGGAVVSNHLTDRARDISIPRGGEQAQTRVRRRLRQLGAHVIDEQEAVGGPHWHVDY